MLATQMKYSFFLVLFCFVLFCCFSSNFVYVEFVLDSGTPSCKANEVPCRSGECLPQETRCNGVRECADGSDELGCRKYICAFYVLLIVSLQKCKSVADKK